MAKILKILVVYKEQEALLMVQNITQTMNLELYSTKASEALNVLRENNIDFALIDTNIENPDCDGLLGELLKAYPGLFIVMMTDQINDPKISDCIKKGAKLGLIRPFKKDDIAVAAQAAESSVFYARELSSLVKKLSCAQGEEKEMLAERIERLKMVVEDIKLTQ